MNKFKSEIIAAVVAGIFGESEKGTESSDHHMKGKHVIIRARDAGVHFGILESASGRTVHLKESRRMWRWWAKKGMTLSAVAVHGLNTEKTELRITDTVSDIEILDACEIILCGADCIKSFAEVEPYNEQ